MTKTVQSEPRIHTFISQAGDIRTAAIRDPDEEAAGCVCCVFQERGCHARREEDSS